MLLLLYEDAVDGNPTGTTAGCIPSTIFVSNNHSDHAAELPVVLGVEGTAPCSLAFFVKVLGKSWIFFWDVSYEDYEVSKSSKGGDRARQNLEVGSMLDLFIFVSSFSKSWMKPICVHEGPWGMGSTHLAWEFLLYLHTNCTMQHIVGISQTY